MLDLPIRAEQIREDVERIPFPERAQIELYAIHTHVRPQPVRVRTHESAAAARAGGSHFLGARGMRRAPPVHSS